MTSIQLRRLSAFEMRQGLLSKEFSAQELLDAHLSFIRESNERYNSFITICETEALDQAAEADATLRELGEKSAALCGIPVALKDNLVTKGVETTCGSKILKGFIPPYDATAVLRLKKQGAVILGKTNLDEFGMGSSNENSAFGPARNPWDTEKVPGGSSGGSAIAVCTGQAPIALGTDTGGSIRQPAALTGILGLKPTYGRVSRYGAIAYASSLDQIGPFARTVEDLAILLEAISGKDARDSTSMDVEVPPYLQSIQSQTNNRFEGLRIGVPRALLTEGLDPQISAAFELSLRELEKLGAKIIDIALPHCQYSLAAYYIITPAEASSNLARYDGVRYGHRSDKATTLREMYEESRASGFGLEVKRRIMIGSYVLSAGYYDAYYRKAQQVRTLIINDFKAAFANSCDLVATPTSPTLPFDLGAKSASPVEMYLADLFTVPVNLAGLPAISIPCGLSKERLPIGLQLIGSPFSELQLLSTARLFLQAQPFTDFFEFSDAQ